jgi:hypothetical protein
MVNLNISFQELKKPIVWVHYALGTVGIIGLFFLMMEIGVLKSTSSIWAYGIMFFISLVLVDRTIHKVLFNESFNNLKNLILLFHYTIDTVGIAGIWSWLMSKGYITATTDVWVMGLVLLVVYVPVDRISHGILELK